MGDQPVAPTGKEIWGLFQKGSPAQSMEARAPHDFEHDALVPGPGNAEHFSSAFTTWRKMKGDKTTIACYPSVFSLPFWGSGQKALPPAIFLPVPLLGLGGAMYCVVARNPIFFLDSRGPFQYTFQTAFSTGPNIGCSPQGRYLWLTNGYFIT
jgi:hypothetical protein